MKTKRKPRPKLYKALPLGLSREIDATDKRHPIWASQRSKYGYDVTELWNLDITIAKFVLPRLKAFKEHQAGYPGYFSTHREKSSVAAERIEIERWHQCLDRMILAFALLTEENGTWDGSPEGREAVRQGLNDFHDFFLSLWS